MSRPLVDLDGRAAASARAHGAPHELAELVASVVRQILAEDLEQLVQHVVDERLAAVSPVTGDDHGGLQAMLRHDGDFWSVRYSADPFLVRDTNGMRCLATLLTQPRRDFAALALAADLDGCVASRPMTAIAIAGERLAVSGGGGAGDVLDPQARAAYRRRLTDLEDVIEESERFNDPERCARACAEMDALTRELSAALGLGGRARRAPGHAERARQRVTKAIRNAIVRLAKHDAALAEHLARTIRTGAICRYDPDPRAAVVWSRG